MFRSAVCGIVAVLLLAGFGECHLLSSVAKAGQEAGGWSPMHEVSGDATSILVQQIADGVRSDVEVQLNAPFPIFIATRFRSQVVADGRNWAIECTIGDVQDHDYAHFIVHSDATSQLTLSTATVVFGPLPDVRLPKPIVPGRWSRIREVHGTVEHPEVVQIANDVRSQVEDRLNGGVPFPEFNAEHFKTQLVAGTNWAIECEIGEVDDYNYVHFIVWQKLDGQLELSDVFYGQMPGELLRPAMTDVWSLPEEVWGDVPHPEVQQIADGVRSDVEVQLNNGNSFPEFTGALFRTQNIQGGGTKFAIEVSLGDFSAYDECYCIVWQMLDGQLQLIGQAFGPLPNPPPLMKPGLSPIWSPIEEVSGSIEHPEVVQIANACRQQIEQSLNGRLPFTDFMAEHFRFQDVADGSRSYEIECDIGEVGDYGYCHFIVTHVDRATSQPTDPCQIANAVFGQIPDPPQPRRSGLANSWSLILDDDSQQYADAQRIADGVRLDVETELDGGVPFSEYLVKHFRTQDVTGGGTNWAIECEIGELVDFNYVHFIVDARLGGLLPDWTHFGPLPDILPFAKPALANPWSRTQETEEFPGVIQMALDVRPLVEDRLKTSFSAMFLATHFRTQVVDNEGTNWAVQVRVDDVVPESDYVWFIVLQLDVDDTLQLTDAGFGPLPPI